MEVLDPHGESLRAGAGPAAIDWGARALEARATAQRIVYGASSLYALVFAVAVTLYYLSFHETRLDLGDMVQAIWSTAHGRLLEFTTPTGQQMSRLGAHVDPFLVLLVPLWWIWPSALAPLLLQVLAVASGALPVYWLARKHLGSERAAVHIALAYLVFPATQFNAFTPEIGFHAVSFALPLLLYAIWFLDEDRLLPFAVIALVAASTKEEIPLAVGCLGIWYAVRKGKVLVGGTIFGLGLGATLVNFLVIVPHYSRPGVDFFGDRYAAVGGTPTGILHKAVTDPTAIVQSVTSGHKLVYLVLLLGPFLGLWLREPLLFLGAVPDLVINLLSATSDQTSLLRQYNAGIVPFLVCASILGAAKLKRHPDRVTLWALVATSCFVLYSPLALARGDLGAVLRSDPHRAAASHALGLVPAGVPVAASNELAGYLSARRYIYIFPYVRNARWVVVDKNDETTVADQRSYERAIATVDARPDWKVVYASHGIQVLRKLPMNGGSSK